jgi:predicted secreted protein
MKKLMLSAVCVLSVFAPLASHASAAPEKAQSQKPVVQQAIAGLNESLKDPKVERNIVCSSTVDCRQKGKDLPRLTVKGRDLQEATGYPSPNRYWDYAKQGYVLKTHGNRDR